MKHTLTVACILLKSAWQAVCRPSSDQLRRQSSPRSGSLRSALLAALLLAPLATLHAAEPKPASKPNVIVVLADDLGYGDLSIHGNTHLQTPHIDKLGAEGVRFDRFYVSSVCAPTRAALLTGRWPLRTGCHGVTHNREAMKPSEVTMAEALNAGG